MVKRIIQTIEVAVFMGILILPSAVWYGARLAAPSVYEKWNPELRENREMGLDYNDNVPFRSILISTEQKLLGNLEEIYTGYLEKKITRMLYGERSDTSKDISGWGTGNGVPADNDPGSEQDGEPEGPAGAGHNYECAEEVPATCLGKGKLVYICKDCGDSYERTIPALGHDGESVFTHQADYLSYGYTEYACRRCGAGYRADFVGKLVDNSYLAPRTVGKYVLLGRFNWLFFTGEDSVAYYRGTNILSEKKMETYLGLMERLQELCDDRDIQLQFMVAPNREQVYPEYMPSYEIVDPYKRLDRFVDYVRENSDVNIIYPLQELKEAELYWRTCYQYDTHWNYLGAFVGTQALYQALGVPVTSPHDVKITPHESSVRGLIDVGGLDGSRYPAEEDYFVDYKPEVTVTYEKGDKMAAGIYYADSDSENRKNFVMLGDSFRCFMTDYIVKDFSHCVIAYRDYADEIKDSIRDADVLVIFAVERYDDEVFPVVEKVIKILEEG